MRWTVLTLLSITTCVNTFIIPDEIPTILSVIYSNIPPIKLGFDTRFGLGFRLGPHADFQTIIEIGPQESTRPIGMESDNVAKRQSRIRAEVKRYRPENDEVDDLSEDTVKENETFQPSLADIILGRKGKKSSKPYFDEIEFKKVPGIDDVKKSSKSIKAAKLKMNIPSTKVSISR